MNSTIKHLLSFLLLLSCAAPNAAQLQKNVAPAPNGIEIPANYKSWKIIGTSHRLDKHSLRVILGNQIAINAVNTHQTNPWPEGTVLAKVVWKETQHPKWPDAIVPGAFEHAEFMIKDQKKYPNTAGWGFARWLGLDQKPYGTTADFAQECVACHAAVKDNDHVFTVPVPLP
ncbi:MAG: cytochrome P460 family protein [Methylococcales bacterium]|nr:cytochrome P460 family protein [Methylococcales bacterium]